MAPVSPIDDPRSRPRLLGALADLHHARQGPVHRSGRVAVTRPRRRPIPAQGALLPRLLAGEFHRRLVLALAAVAIVVVIVTAVGGFFS